MTNKHKNSLTSCKPSLKSWKHLKIMTANRMTLIERDKQNSTADIINIQNQQKTHLCSLADSSLKELIQLDWIIALPNLPQFFKVSSAGKSAWARYQADQWSERYQHQQKLKVTKAIKQDNNKTTNMHSINARTSPLEWLASRKDRNGNPYLTPYEIEAGEMLCRDFEKSQMGPQVAQNWDRFMARVDASPTQFERTDLSANTLDSRTRLTSALHSLGAGLSDIAFRSCCFHEGIEQIEKDQGWSARSGKVVLKLALSRLADFYGIIPNSSNGRILTWQDEIR